MQFDTSVFRAYDIRGLYGKQITPYFAKCLGVAFGELFRESECVVVGRDARFSSPDLCSSLIEGLRASNMKVLNIGEVPNPLAYFACWNRKLYGIYITASHNPPEYNGFKFIRPDGTSLIEEYQKLKEYMLSKEFTEVGEARGIEERLDIIDDYVKAIKRVVKISESITIAIETFGGVAGKVLPEILAEFGVEALMLRPTVRGDFYGIRPEPKGENLKPLRQKVLEKKCAFGVAFDGDADRAVFVDDRGEELTGSESGIVYVKGLVRPGDKVVITPDTASALARTIEEKSGKVVWSRIGHCFIERKVLEEKAVFGIEQSSHFYHGYIYPFSDGILSALKMAELLEHLGRISEVLSSVEINPTEKFYIHVGDDQKKWKVVNRVKNMYPDAQAFHDGVRITLARGWVLIRASQTMPEVNICIEAENRELLEKYKEEFSNLVLKLAKEE